MGDGINMFAACSKIFRKKYDKWYVYTHVCNVHMETEKERTRAGDGMNAVKN